MIVGDDEAGGIDDKARAQRSDMLGPLALGPRKFLNRSSSGEPGGRLGMAWGGGAFRVWVVAILTTVGSSLAARSAKESGAGRAKAPGQGQSGTKQLAQTACRSDPVAGIWIRGLSISLPFPAQTGRNAPQCLNRKNADRSGVWNRVRWSISGAMAVSPRRHSPCAGPGHRPGQRPQRGAAEHDCRAWYCPKDGHVGFALEVPPAQGPAAEPLRAACEAAVAKLPGVFRSPPC